MEAEILSEIRDSEKKSDSIIESAKRKKEEMLHEAAGNSSKLLSEKEEETRKSQEKRIMDFRDKAKSEKNERLKEGEKLLKQMTAKAEKNIDKAADIIMKKFEEMI